MARGADTSSPGQRVLRKEERRLGVVLRGFYQGQWPGTGFPGTSIDCKGRMKGDQEERRRRPWRWRKSDLNHSR